MKDEERGWRFSVLGFPVDRVRNSLEEEGPNPSRKLKAANFRPALLILHSSSFILSERFSSESWNLSAGLS